MFFVTIAWGTEETRAENPEGTMNTYRFATEGEKSAFLDGIDACLGWDDYEVIAESGETDNESRT